MARPPFPRNICKLLVCPSTRALVEFVQHAGDKAAMNKGRLEAFSDGVIAIIITIMVLELKVPHGADLQALQPAVAGVPQLRAELRLRRHLLEQPPPPAPRRASTSNGAVLWANLHLLFWLSLVPFVTGWMGENHFAPVADGASTASCC